MDQHRQLAAIMFTDIEGYTAIMQKDEQRAIQLKDRHREVLQKEHKTYRGRIIQYYGDGTLSIFNSAVEAVQCAMEMQILFRGTEPHVPVRIGVHIGDIIFDEDHIFGDGVNLASRIESLGKSGSVLLSSKVNDEITNHPELKTYSVGVYKFKNIKHKVEVFALDHAALVLPSPGSLQGKTDDKKPAAPVIRTKLPPKSIAVLPFANMSNDPEQEFFGEGIGEEILNSLSGLKDLKVASRTSSFQFNQKNIDLREIGERLGVSTVLEGSVRKQGKKLRVTVQLINVEDGFHLWSEKYDGSIDDIFAIQDQIAMATTEKLKVILLENDKARITRSHTQNSEAYELYLKGRFHLAKRGAHIITGIHYFQLAIDLDPKFALAHSGFADANLMAAFYGLVTPRQVIYKAKQAAETAIKLDPTLSEPYCSLGCFYSCFEWNWQEAEKNFLTALEINHKYTQAHYWYGSLYLAWSKGDMFGAEMHARIAVELEPQNAACYGMQSSVLHTCGKFGEALAAAKKGLEIDPESFLCHLYLGWSNLGLRNYEEAINAFEFLSKMTNGHHFAQNALIIGYCTAWKFKQARQSLEDLQKRSANEFVAFAVPALSYAHLNDLDKAFEYFDQAFEARDPLLLSLKYEHWVPDSLKEDPRYGKLLERIGFP